nr:hypothetical protein [Tanacetum cinerariifolium]
MMNKNFTEMMRQFQTVKVVDTKCETCGGPHSFTDCPAVGGYTQETAYATTGNYNSGDLKAITTRSGVTLARPSVSPPPLSKEVDREPETITDQVLTGSTNNVLPLVVQMSLASTFFSTISSFKMPEVTKDTCMRTRFSSNLVGESSPNPTSSNSKRRNRRCLKQPFILKESPVYTMADQHTMAELLRAPTEGYTEAIMVLPILVEHFELKHSLINMMTSNQFFGLEKDNPHDHILKSSDGNSSSSSEIAKLTHAVNQQTSAVTTAMTAILKQFQAIPPPAFVKAVEEICVTCGGAHPYYQFVPLSELEKIKKMNEINMKAMQTQINNVKNELINEIKTSIQASISNQTNELKNMMANFFQMNTASTSGSGPLPSNTIANPKGELKAITTRSGLVLDGPSIPMPPPFINPEEDERVQENLTDLKLAVILKKLPEKLKDPRKFLIPYGFSELKCKALADLGAIINLTPLSVWKKLAGITRDVFVPVVKFIFLADFVIVDYESDYRVPLILGRPFLRTARALIDIHGEEMFLHDESINMINIFNDSCEDYLEDLFATNHLSGNLTFSSHTNLTSPKVINPLSGSTTSSSPDHLLEEFADELALITFPSRNDDLPFDIESDLREIEYLLNHDPTKEMDSILEDSVDKDNLEDLNDNLVDTILEMFTDEHALDYSSLPLYDEYDDDLFELESNYDNAYNDLFDSKEDKIKESKLLIGELDPLRSSDFLPSPKYDSLLFEDFF